MSGIQTLTKTRITGEVTAIRFENSENGFAVISFLCTDGSKLAVKGPLAGVSKGQSLEADGYFENHPDFGRQFRAESYRIIPPSIQIFSPVITTILSLKIPSDRACQFHLFTA